MAAFGGARPASTAAQGGLRGGSVPTSISKGSSIPVTGARHTAGAHGSPASGGRCNFYVRRTLSTVRAPNYVSAATAKAPHPVIFHNRGFIGTRFPRKRRQTLNYPA